LWGVFCHTPDEGSAGFIVVATRIVFNSYAQQQQQAWQWYIVMATRATRAAARAATNVAKRVGNKKGIASNKQTAPMQTAPRTAHRAIAKHTNDKRITLVG
jgi:predicted DsbA family dithiol-disulfide isomerase